MGYSGTKTRATLGTGEITIKDIANSDDLTRLNSDTTKLHHDLYKGELSSHVEAQLDTRLLTKEGQAQLKQEYKDMNKNMKTIAETLPSAISDNPVESTVAKAWNGLSMMTLGILPSNNNNGGILAQIPILSGNKTANDKALQVLNTVSPKYNEKDYMRLEESDYYKALSQEQQQALANKELYISKVPLTITKETATYQNSVNGIMNTEGEAIINGLQQTGQWKTPTDKPVELTVGYNATHGLLGDLLESAVDKSGIGTTGTAITIGEFARDVTTSRGTNGSNFSLHSQGNALMYSGIQWVESNDNTGAKFKPQSYFISKTEFDEKGQPKSGIPTAVSFGAPIGSGDMDKVIGEEGLKYNYKGSYTKPGDFVGEVLGGNAGNNDTRSIFVRATDIINPLTYFNVLRLFTPSSPHSSYDPTNTNNEELNKAMGYEKIQDIMGYKK